MRAAMLLKDPLTHFLAAGVLLFLIARAAAPSAEPEKTIVVDRAALLAHIQYRSKAFNKDAAEAFLDELDANKRARLIAEFIREEALSREAVALGLDAGDYVIRQRLVQKAAFVAEAATPAPELSVDEIAAFYEANKDRYLSPPAATLTHVFVSAENRPREAARAAASELLRRLKLARARFEDAPRYGDRFIFHKNYVDRTDDYIRSQLGPEAAAAIFDPEIPLGDWTGPYSSPYGEHLILVAKRTPARLAPPGEIEDLVRSDAAEEMRRRAIDEAIRRIVSGYRVIDRSETSE